MLAVVGILATDLLGRGNWWTAGAEVSDAWQLRWQWGRVAPAWRI